MSNAVIAILLLMPGAFALLMGVYIGRRMQADMDTRETAEHLDRIQEAKEALEAEIIEHLSERQRVRDARTFYYHKRDENTDDIVKGILGHTQLDMNKMPQWGKEREHQ